MDTCQHLWLLHSAARGCFERWLYLGRRLSGAATATAAAERRSAQLTLCAARSQSSSAARWLAGTYT